MSRLGLLIIFAAALLIMFPVILKVVFFFGLCFIGFKLAVWTISGYKKKGDPEVISSGDSWQRKTNR